MLSFACRLNVIKHSLNVRASFPNVKRLRKAHAPRGARRIGCRASHGACASLFSLHCDNKRVVIDCHVFNVSIAPRVTWTGAERCRAVNIVDSVKIEGLWGIRDLIVSFPLDKHHNFIVGQNGTGKTTVINLLAAALVADFDRLDRIQFSRLEITLKAIGSRKKPAIAISKIAKADVPYFDIKYQIKESATSAAKTFDLDAFAEERFYRGMPPRMLRERVVRQKFLDIQKELESIVKVCWLSVNRHADEPQVSDERKHLSAVDQKLASLNNELVRFFSQLARRYADDTLEFQKNAFLSLLTPEKEQALIDLSKKIDLESEKKSLSNVFELLGVESKLYGRKLETHLSKFTDAVEKFEKTKSLTTIQFSAMYNLWKTHSLVQHYESLQKKRSEIFAPRDNFISVVNELFSGRKLLQISDRNEIVVETKSGRTIPIQELSSGEKQLLIILGEALLQENSSVVYIADEPELSLHVTWQERLTDSIMRLNPNAQIIFATHSPDIVGAYSQRIIDMEGVIR